MPPPTDPDEGSARPVLRAEAESGRVVDDPSEGALMRMLMDVAQGREGYMIIERLTDPTGQTYAQSQRLPDGSLVVEHRAGSPQTHVGTTVPTVREAHRLLAGWAHDVPGWDAGEDWQPVDLG